MTYPAPDPTLARQRFEAGIRLLAEMLLEMLVERESVSLNPIIAHQDDVAENSSCLPTHSA